MVLVPALLSLCIVLVLVTVLLLLLLLLHAYTQNPAPCPESNQYSPQAADHRHPMTSPARPAGHADRRPRGGLGACK